MVTVNITITDIQSTVIFTRPMETKGIVPGLEQTLSFEQEVLNPLKWTAETPNLYFLTFEVKDNKGRVLEVVTRKIGFREVEIVNAQLLVNGEPIEIKGTNRHEFILTKEG